MTLAVYPLVYLPVAASLRNADPVPGGDVPQPRASGRSATFCGSRSAQARGAILGGCLLVALVMLAEYGAFEILGYQTFTTEIFTEFHAPSTCRRRARCRSCWSLVSRRRASATCGCVAEGRWRAPAPAHNGAPRARPRAGDLRSCLASSRWSGWPSACRSAPRSTGWCAGRRLRSAGSLAAQRGRPHRALQRPRRAIATIAALPARVARVRYRVGAARLLERSTLLVLAMPGLVIALALSLLRRAVRRRLPLPERVAADAGLRDPVLPARARRGARFGRCGRRPGSKTSPARSGAGGSRCLSV